MSFLTLLLLFSTTTAVVVHENVIFTKTNELTTSRSRWLMTLVIDLESYQRFINKLQYDINETNALVEIMSRRYKKHKLFRYLNILSAIRNEIKIVENTFDGIKESYLDYGSIRNKRSLLPIIGSLMSKLFGTLSEDDLKNIQEHVNNLAVNQQNIAHVLDKSLSVLNLTRVQVSENRHSINDIVKTLHVIDKRLINVTQMLETRLTEMEHFITVYLQIDLVVEELKQGILKATLILEHLKNQLNVLSNERLTTAIISPRNLQKMLLEIKSKLSRSLRLPDDPSKMLWKFYKYLKVNTVITKKHILVVVSIPLLDFSSNFEIFDVHNLQIPFNESQPTSLSAKYEIETNKIAFNPERTKYILLNEKDVKQCSTLWLHYCRIQNPIYSISLSKHCLVALFLKHNTNINSYCKTVVQTQTVFPYAEYISQEHWIIVSDRKFQLSVVCLNNTQRHSIIQIRPPIEVIIIARSCVGSSDYFALLSPFNGKSTFEIKDSFIDLINTQVRRSQIHLWEPIYDILPNFSKISIPEELREIKEIPLDHLIMKLGEHRPVNFTSKEWPIWSFLLVGVVIFIVFITAVILYRLYGKRIKTFWLARKGVNGEKETKISDPGYSAVTQSTSMDSTARGDNSTLDEEMIPMEPIREGSVNKLRRMIDVTSKN